MACIAGCARGVDKNWIGRLSVVPTARFVEMSGTPIVAAAACGKGSVRRTGSRDGESEIQHSD